MTSSDLTGRLRSSRRFNPLWASDTPVYCLGINYNKNLTKPNFKKCLRNRERVRKVGKESGNVIRIKFESTHQIRKLNGGWSKVKLNLS